jgi:hypothetical protein
MPEAYFRRSDLAEQARLKVEQQALTRLRPRMRHSFQTRLLLFGAGRFRDDRRDVPADLPASARIKSISSLICLTISPK